MIFRTRPATGHKTRASTATRQHARRVQRGHLSRSTLLALALIACAGVLGGLVLTKRDAMHMAYLDAQQAFIHWTAQQGFAVEDVKLSGRKQVAADFVMAALQVERGMPILRYDPRAAQERLLENPWIRSAKIERRLPHTVFIRIVERVPVARWQVDGKLVLVDAEGVALSTDETPEIMERYRHLPIVIGQEARSRLVALFSLLAGEPEIGKQVVAATWIGNRRWDLTLRNRMVIRMPAQEPELALTRLAVLVRDKNVLERDLVAIDLRLPDRAVLTPTGRANALIERPDFSDTPDLSRKNI